MASVPAVLSLLTSIAARQREQWLSPDELRARRVSRLRRLAIEAARTPYWAEVFRRHRIDPAALDDGPAFERLPILEKSTMQDQTMAMLSAPSERLFRIKSSGSTGRPVQLFRSEWDQAQVSALHVRIGGAFGRRPLDCQVSIGSGGAVASKGPVVLLRRMGVLPQMHRLLSVAPLDEQLAAVRRLRPRVING